MSTGQMICSLARAALRVSCKRLIGADQRHETLEVYFDFQESNREEGMLNAAEQMTQLRAGSRNHSTQQIGTGYMKILYRTLLLAAFAVTPATAAESDPGPIIDVHVHAFGPDRFGPPGQTMCAPSEYWPARDPAEPMSKYLDAYSGHPDCAHKFKAPLAADEIRKRTMAELKRNHVVLAVTSGDADEVEHWRQQEPDLILPGLHLGRTGTLPDIAELRRLHAAGQLKVLGEIAAQNGGMAPNDPKLEPLYALAEELDIPVAFHTGLHAPGTAYFGSRGYRAINGDPLLFEEVLVRHPRMRIYLCHSAWPLEENLIALLYAHPQVYVDTSAIDWFLPRAEFHRYLQRLVEAGFAKRIMYGTDQMLWPESIPIAIKNIETAKFLTSEQKRDIFYNNAARFFRITDKTPSALRVGVSANK
ncbi:amidohydrolase [Bradyrhizobium sp. KB893862 SZCCT0404]|uniref:amidohydrolase family protein n=1 Tax=Bradyrhizobium sp. KB893862 SZCCT0404 TaxID=2807672 RepID=UPI001BABCF15|nr:amidohydrolase family protein [Bradyrhizobium sp. KB893862 SZCCT0404]MBR1177027.1 amidohydrolase [Bradyrhizobium sp. KB893862 SZCCT0404]